MFERREELRSFKREINLIEYAVSYGYEIDRKASSRGSAVLRHPDGDKVVIARDTAGCWIYFSVRDDQDNGTIIDFVQQRRSVSLGEVRRELRQWVPGCRAAALPSSARRSAPPTLQPASPKDLEVVRARFETMRPVAGRHAYLESERGIPADVLKHPRFAGCIRTDARGNAVFPHWNAEGLCGFELKNRGFIGFALGGVKGLWSSATWADDSALVITESAIDALSHFALRRPPFTRYASTAGALNHVQPDLIRQAVASLPPRSVVIIATDNDAGGDKLAAVIRELLAPLASQVRIIEDRPIVPGADWNDLLRNPTPVGRGR